MNNFETNEFQSVLSDKTFRLTADRLVLKCGVRIDLKGSVSLSDAVILYGTEASTSFCEIYRIIAEVRGLKPKSVMRAISYAISQSHDISSKLSALTGTSIRYNDIHNGLVIAYLGTLFRNPSLAVYS